MFETVKKFIGRFDIFTLRFEREDSLKELDEAEAEIKRLNKVITDFDINKIRADLFKANETSNHYKAMYERSHEQSQTILDK